jgi:hypothetical protein
MMSKKLGHPSNRQRRITGRRFIDRAELTYENGRVVDSLVDMLTDIRHSCGQKPGIDFDNCVRLSEMHYQDEIKGNETRRTKGGYVSRVRKSQ